MMSFKCAFLGCGPRANGHAAAYAHITRGHKVACCDLDPERLSAFAAKYDIPATYTSLEEMLDKEKPDLVHMVTRPNLRVGLMQQLADAGVPAVLVEKPICIGADDYKALRSLDAATKTKYAVNHQLRHHPQILSLLQDVQDGKFGEVQFIDASAVLPMSGQGVHVLDLLFAFNGYAPVKTVFGASSGYTDLGCSHPSPNDAESLLTFENGVRAALQAGVGSPIFEEGATWAHKRIAVYGTHGYFHWRMYAWEKSLPDGTVERGKKDYGAEDVLGQANLTNAMFDWIEDDSQVAPTNLQNSLDEWLVILAGYLSSVEARPINFPFDPPNDLLDQFKQFVGAE
ncbi:MAG: Gfo/Idh/MocA family oxidoreductase [Armatimonadia bacterium]